MQNARRPSWLRSLQSQIILQRLQSSPDRGKRWSRRRWRGRGRGRRESRITTVTARRFPINGNSRERADAWRRGIGGGEEGWREDLCPAREPRVGGISLQEEDSTRTRETDGQSSFGGSITVRATSRRGGEGGGPYAYNIDPRSR